MIANDHKAGYRIEKVYVADQSYPIVPDHEGPIVDSAADRKIAFGWDWRPIGAKRVPLDISINDVVVYSKYGGTEVKYNGEEYLILSARDVLAVVEK